jgi:hypothetical protein
MILGMDTFSKSKLSAVKNKAATLGEKGWLSMDTRKQTNE